ncbi:MAG: HAMP domain-containing protein [Alphaproteobacteria bacterium]|nr:HAMP domain-containing protein [Alphaproteobacteria bacterium]
MPNADWPRLAALVPSSLKGRLILAAGVWTLTVLIAAGIGLATIFRGSVERSFDQRLIADMEIVIAAAEPQLDGRLVIARASVDPRYDNAFSGWYWQVSEGGGPSTDAPPMAPITSRSLWDKTLTIPEWSEEEGMRTGYTTGPEGQELRIIERDITLPDLAASAQGRRGLYRPYRFAVAGDRASIEAEIETFNTTLIGTLAVLGLGVVVAIVLQVSVGLRPLDRVRRALTDIRSGRAVRLEGEFPSEIEPLAHELNALLAHNAEVLARARTHVGNLAHFLKTPLTILTNEAEARGGPLAESVLKQASAMRRQVDHYLVRARAAAAVDVIGSRTDLNPVIADLARTLGRIYDRRGIEIETQLATDLVFRGERQDLEELVGNLIDNACKWARSAVRVTSALQADGRIAVLVEDDGPGMTQTQSARALERGERLDESVPGSGLGLGIVRDLSRLYGGDIQLGRSEALGGLLATLLLPAATR